MNLKQYFNDIFAEHVESGASTASLMGMQSEDSNISKMLVQLVRQAEKFGAQLITFQLVGDNPDSVVFFHRPDSKREATPIPTDLVRPLISHAIWQINHQDPFFQKLGKTVARSESNFLNCRCWLENPKDITTVMIELVDPAPIPVTQAVVEVATSEGDLAAQSQ